MVDRANSTRHIQALLPPPDTDDLMRKPPLAKRQTN
jgi:hypothetical protein